MYYILANSKAVVNKKRTQVRFICSFVDIDILVAATIDIDSNTLVVYKAALDAPRAHDNFLAR